MWLFCILNIIWLSGIVFGGAQINRLIERIKDNPIIAAIRKANELEEALQSEVTTIFILNADIFNVKGMVDKIKASEKSALIHIDFVEGLGRDNKAVDYIAEIVKPDGIISTRSNQIKYAKELGLFTIQRFFLIDSMSYHTSIKLVQTVKPDMIEIMPGVIPGVISRIRNEVSIPVIAGGLIDTKQDIIEILKAGALGASTGKTSLWTL